MYFIKVDDGTKIAVEDLNRSSNKVVVLVHGWPISKDMYEYQKDCFIDQGYRVVSYDIRGFGKSDTSASGYDYDRLATDLWCVIDNLKVESVTLVGFSMGGAICVHYMAMFDNDYVDKLVLAGAAAPSFNKTLHNPYGNTTEETNALIELAYRDRPQMITKFSEKLFANYHTPAFQDWFHQLCLQASGIGTIKTAISLRDEDVFDDLQKIKVPTAILHGKHDQICPFEFATIMDNEIPNATLIPFEYSGHGLFYDEREKFNQVIIQFMEY